MIASAGMKMVTSTCECRKNVLGPKDIFIIQDKGYYICGFLILLEQSYFLSFYYHNDKGKGGGKGKGVKEKKGGDCTIILYSSFYSIKDYRFQWN